MRMRKTIHLAGVVVAAALTAQATLAQQADGESTAEKPPAARLRVQLVETSQKDGVTTASRSCALLLQADDKASEVASGIQFPLSTTGEKGAPTVVFKDAGVEARVSAEPQADGRYRVQAQYARTSLLAPGPGTGGLSRRETPILRAHVRADSRITLREGETLPLATTVDPATGELVRVDLTVSAARPKAAPAGAAAGSRLRARFSLTRRQGEKTTASRPYSVLLPAGEEQAANVFSGNQLPLETTYQGQATVVIKDVGAGARLTAHRVPDGRYRLDVEFSDDVLAPGQGTPDLHSFRTRSSVVVALHETVVLASAPDSQSGEQVAVEVTLEGAE